MEVSDAASSRSRPAGRQRQRGASILEAAVIFVPFLAIFFAIFDFGMALFLKNTMQFAVRQGVRYAVTSQIGTDVNGNALGQDASIKQVVDKYSFGFLEYLAPPTDPICQGTGCISINYYQQTLGTTPTLTLVTGTGSNAQGNIVEITASGLTYSWLVPLLRTATPLQFSVSSADIMEAQPNGPPAR
jgi:Flp pilus assembly protein TadG